MSAELEAFWPAVNALSGYQQADEDGVMVLASRQAIEEVLLGIASMEQRIVELERQLVGLLPNKNRRIAELETEIERLENINGQLADALQSPVHKQLGQARAENKRLREAASRVVKRYDNIGRIDLSPLRAALKETGDAN